MKKIVLPLLVILLSLTSCISSRKLQATATIPSGTEVQYSKVINPAYARDYIGADIVTEAEFYSAGKANNVATKVPKGHVVFQVIPIGGSAKNAPFGGGQVGNYTFIPKSQSDIIFDLKPGDKIQLRGGTRVQKYFINGIEVIEFIAISVTKL